MSNEKVQVYVEICHKDAVLPSYANIGDAGMDVYAVEDTIIHPGETKAVRTGLKFAIPLGYEIQVRPRSGISFRTPLRIPNSPGTIDSGYRDELYIIITNTSESCFSDSDHPLIELTECKKGKYIIKKGDRIAQIIIMPVPKIEFVPVESVLVKGINRNGGIGSTGVSGKR